MANFKSQNTRWGPPSCVPDKMRPHSYYLDSAHALITDDNWYKFELGGELRGDPRYGPLHLGLSKLCLDLSLKAQITTALLTEEVVGSTDISFEIANTTDTYKGVNRVIINFTIDKIEHYVMLPYIIVHATNFYLKTQTHLVNGWLVFSSTYTLKIVNTKPAAPSTPTFDYYGDSLIELWMPTIKYTAKGLDTIQSNLGFDPQWLDDQPRHKIMISFNQEIGPLFKRVVEGKDISLLQDQSAYMDTHYSFIAASPAAQFQNFTDTMFPQYYVNYMFLAKNQNNVNLLYALWPTNKDFADDPNQPLNKTLWYTQPVTSTTSNVRKNTAFPAIQCVPKNVQSAIEVTKITGNTGSYGDIIQWGALGTEVILPEKPFRKLYGKTAAGDFIGISSDNLNITGLETYPGLSRNYGVKLKQVPKILYFNSSTPAISRQSWPIVSSDPPPAGEFDQSWDSVEDTYMSGTWHIYNPDGLVVFSDFSFEMPFEKTNFYFGFKNRSRQLFRAQMTGTEKWRPSEIDKRTKDIILANKFGIKFYKDRFDQSTFETVVLYDEENIQLFGVPQLLLEEVSRSATYPSTSGAVFPTKTGCMRFFNRFRFTQFQPPSNLPNNSFNVLNHWAMATETTNHPGDKINLYSFYYKFYDAFFQPYVLTDYCSVNANGSQIDSAECLLELKNSTTIDPNLKKLISEANVNRPDVLPDTYNRYSMKAPWANAINRTAWIRTYEANDETCSPTFLARLVYNEQTRYMIEGTMKIVDGPDLMQQIPITLNKTRVAEHGISCHYAKYFIPDEVLNKATYLYSGQRFYGGALCGAVGPGDMTLLEETLYEYNGKYKFDDPLNLFNEYTTGFAAETPLDFYNSYAGHYPIVGYFTAKSSGLSTSSLDSRYYSSSPNGVQNKRGVNAHLYDYDISADAEVNGSNTHPNLARCAIHFIDVCPFWLEFNTDGYEKYDLNTNHPYKKLTNRTLANVNTQRWRSPYCSCLEIGQALRSTQIRVNVIPEAFYPSPLYFHTFNQHTNVMTGQNINFYATFRADERTRLAVPFEYGTDATNSDPSIMCYQYLNNNVFGIVYRTHVPASGNVLRDETAFNQQLSMPKFLERTIKTIQVSKYRLNVPAEKNKTVPDTRWLVQPGGSIGTVSIYSGSGTVPKLPKPNATHMTLWCSVAPVYNNPAREPLLNVHWKPNWVYFKEYSRNGNQTTNAFIQARNGLYAPSTMHYKNATLDWLSTTCSAHIDDLKWVFNRAQMENIDTWSSSLGPYSATIFMKPYSEEQNKQFALYGQHLFLGQLVTNISVQHGDVNANGLDRQINVLGSEQGLMFERRGPRPTAELEDSNYGYLYETNPATMGWSSMAPRCTIFHPGKLTTDMINLGITDEKWWRVQRCPPNVLIPVKAGIAAVNAAATEADANALHDVIEQQAAINTQAYETWLTNNNIFIAAHEAWVIATNDYTTAIALWNTQHPNGHCSGHGSHSGHVLPVPPGPEPMDTQGPFIEPSPSPNRITVLPPSEDNIRDTFNITPNSIDNCEKLWPIHFEIDHFESRYAAETDVCSVWLNFINVMSTKKSALNTLVGPNKTLRAAIGTETSHIYSINVCSKEVSNEYYSNIPIIYQLYTRGVVTTTTDVLKYNNAVINVLWQGSDSVFEVIENDIQNVEFFPLTGKTGHSTGGTLQQFHFAVYLDDQLIKPKDISKFACVVNVMQNNPETGDITPFNGLPLNEFY